MNASEINAMIRRIQMAQVKIRLVERITDAILWVLLIIALGCVLMIPESRAAEISKTEIATESLLAVDWAQTRDMVRHQSYCDSKAGLPFFDLIKDCGKHEYYETNPIIGKHPSMGRVNTYFATVMLGHYLIDRNLSAANQDRFEWATIILESAVVLHNRQIGLSVRF